jgi:endonuclease YncB( thermonuclease family)
VQHKLWQVVCLLSIAATLSCGVAPSSAISSSLACPDCPIVSVERVVDGDTFDTPEGRVRLFGVDTPERGDKCFTEATDRLRELAGDSVRVESGPRS